MVAPIVVFGVIGLIGFLAANANAAPAVGPKHIALPPGIPKNVPTTKEIVKTPSGSTAVEVFPSEEAVLSSAKAAPKEPAAMPKSLQEALAGALKLLTVDSNGKIKGPVTANAVRAATQIAGRLDSEGWPEASKSLRAFATEAAKLVPPPKKADEIPLPPSMDPALRDKVQRMIQNERDPAKLQGLVDALKATPKGPERDMAIEVLKGLIVQIQTANISRKALEDAEAVMNAPTGSLAPAKQKPKALETPKAPVVVVTKTTVPKAQPTPAAKTPVQQAAESMALHLRSVQSKYGMPGAKGKEDPTIVKRFQNKAGITEDGKAGPGTLGKAASVGQGDLPLVMYWPAGSNRSSVQVYRDTLRRLASEAEAQGRSDVGNQLRMIANLESGQGGISAYGPQLT